MFLPADYTIADFKAYFYRDFNYAPYYITGKTYALDTIVYYQTTELFYKCKVASTTALPTDTNAWDILSPQLDILSYITDADITKAIQEATMMFNVNLGFDKDSNAKIAFSYLTAHFLSITLNLNGASNGTSGLLSSRSVGNVSEGYTIPEWMQNAGYAFFRNSLYGVKYAELTRSLRFANTMPFIIQGMTTPVLN